MSPFYILLNCSSCLIIYWFLKRFNWGIGKSKLFLYHLPPHKDILQQQKSLYVAPAATREWRQELHRQMLTEYHIIQHHNSQMNIIYESTADHQDITKMWRQLTFKEGVKSECDLITNRVIIKRHGLAGRQHMYQHLSLEPVAVQISGLK